MKIHNAKEKGLNCKKSPSYYYMRWTFKYSLNKQISYCK